MLYRFFIGGCGFICLLIGCMRIGEREGLVFKVGSFPSWREDWGWMRPAGLGRMGRGLGLNSWSWQQQVLLTMAGLYSMSRGSVSPGWHCLSWLVRPFPSARWLWPQFMLVESSGFLPPTLETPKRGGWQPVPDQACPSLNSLFYSQVSESTKSCGEGTCKIGVGLGSAALPGHRVGMSSLSLLQGAPPSTLIPFTSPSSRAGEAFAGGEGVFPIPCSPWGLWALQDWTMRECCCH